jgi:predicted nucleotidyltransferase
LVSCKIQEYYNIVQLCGQSVWRLALMTLTPAIIEGFAVETEDGLIFTVKGINHPPNRIIAYLRYLRDPTGCRRRGGTNYRRVYSFAEQQAILKKDYPIYLALDPALGIQVQSVPRHLIHTIYDPVAWLAALRTNGPADALEAQTLQCVDLLQSAAGVSPSALGVSGSTMLGLHTAASDIDLVVYGEAAGRAVHRTLGQRLADPAGPLRRLNQAELAALYAAHQPDTPLSFSDFARLQRRKVNEARFGERPLFIRFVKRADESSEVYGADRFEPRGTATIRALVTDDRAAIFTPCCYEVVAVEFKDGPAVEMLTEIVSFRGRFSDQVRTEEWLIARGNLERVTTSDGKIYHRLVVGGQAGDYLLAEE